MPKGRKESTEEFKESNDSKLPKEAKQPVAKTTDKKNAKKGAKSKTIDLEQAKQTLFDKAKTT